MNGMRRYLGWAIWIVLLCVAPVWAAPPLVFSWDASTSQPGLIPMAWIYCANDTPVAAVSRVAGVFSRLPPGQRTLFLFGVLTSPPVFTVANLKSIAMSGPDCSSEQRYLQMIFTRLRAQRLIPSRIVLDFESSLVTWKLSPPQGNLSTIVMPVYADSACFRKLPAAVQRYSPADFDNLLSARGRAAMVAWNAWQLNIADAALRVAVVATANRCLAANIPITNYGDMRPSFPVFDANGWPVSTAAVGTESSPSLYLVPGGIAYQSLKKNILWNVFIENLNLVRSSLHNGPVVPWLSYPSYAGDGVPQIGDTWLWQQMIQHLNQMGVSEYLYFNPSPATKLADNQLASQTFCNLPPRGVPPKTGYPAIPFDSDEVITGTVRTTYSDFLKNLPPAVPAPVK